MIAFEFPSDKDATLQQTLAVPQQTYIIKKDFYDGWFYCSMSKCKGHGSCVDLSLTLSDPGAGELISCDITLLQVMPRCEPEPTGRQLDGRERTGVEERRGGTKGRVEIVGCANKY